MSSNATQQISGKDPRCLAEAVRAACVQAALDGYQDARMDGLCREGAWEAAVAAMRALDLDALFEKEYPFRSSIPTISEF